MNIKRVNLFLGTIAVVACLTSAVQAAEKRCGWYENPTPGNMWLSDKDAAWSMTSQMQANGPDAEGLDNAPGLDAKQFVATNNPGSGHGYGCACLTVDVDASAQRITKIYSGEILPLATCQADKSLPSPGQG